MVVDDVAVTDGNGRVVGGGALPPLAWADIAAVGVRDGCPTGLVFPLAIKVDVVGADDADDPKAPEVDGPDDKRFRSI